MLLAEIHRKVVEGAENDEDYLTSAVFGHLRYIPPTMFWGELFRRAVGMEAGKCLANLLPAPVGLAGYSRLETYFWPRHPEYGQPDLILLFSGEGYRSVVIVIEVKLWSKKGGEGDNDQLGRYIRLLDDLEAMKLSVGLNSKSFLVYLTPRDSTDEVEESLTSMPCLRAQRDRVFRLQWQDVEETARLLGNAELPPGHQAGMADWAATILADVADFLGRRNLAYFRGFRQFRELEMAAGNEGAFYSSSPGMDLSFGGMAVYAGCEAFSIESAAWMTAGHYSGFSVSHDLEDMAASDGAFFSSSPVLDLSFCGMSHDINLEIFLIEKGAWAHGRQLRHKNR